MDIDGNGVFTISDVWEFLVLLFYLPGDTVVSMLIGTPFGIFFEFTYQDLGGWFSLIISACTWGVVWGIAALIKESITND